MKQEIINKITKAKIVAIVRLDNKANVRPVLLELIDSGITVLEITSNTPGFLDHISWARKEFPEACIGAGTITNVQLAEQSHQAGAQFLVTPNMNTDVIQFAKLQGLVTLMGAMTPTDIASGLNNQADFIKLFPAGHLGIDYFKMMLAPYNAAKFIAVGGINESNAAEWLDAGAAGIGIGGSLTNALPLKMRESAQKLLALIQQY